jgi:hypothetical protein
MMPSAKSNVWQPISDTTQTPDVTNDRRINATGLAAPQPRRWPENPRGACTAARAAKQRVPISISFGTRAGYDASGVSALADAGDRASRIGELTSSERIFRR